MNRSSDVVRDAVDEPSGFIHGLVDGSTAGLESVETITSTVVVPSDVIS